MVITQKYLDVLNIYYGCENDHLDIDGNQGKSWKHTHCSEGIADQKI